MRQYFVIRRIAQRYGIQAVGCHKFIEDVGTQHHRPRYRDSDAIEVITYGIFLDDGVDKCQAAPFAAKGPLSDTRKVAVMVKSILAEHCHHATVLHLAILDYQLKEQLSRCRCIGDRHEAVTLDNLGYREERSAIQPARNIVVGGMQIQRPVGYIENVLLQALEVAYTHYLVAGLGVSDDEVAEAEVRHNCLTKVHWQLLGVLIQEYPADTRHLYSIRRLRRLYNQRQVWVALAQIARQAQSGMLVLHALALERHIADHTEHIVAIALIQRYRLLIISRKHHLGTPAHTQHLLVLIERLGREFARLGQQKAINMWQYRRIEAHRVLHDHYHLHTDISNIGGIQPILEQLDDCQQQIHVTKPREYIVNFREVLAGKPPRHLLREGGQHYQWYIGMRVLDAPATLDRLSYLARRHHYHQIVMSRRHALHRLGCRRHTTYARWRTQVERHILHIQLLVDAPILLHHEGIIARRHKQHIEYAALHQLVKRCIFQIQSTQKLLIHRLNCLVLHLKCKVKQKTLILQSIFSPPRSFCRLNRRLKQQDPGCRHRRPCVNLRSRLLLRNPTFAQRAYVVITA